MKRRVEENDSDSDAETGAKVTKKVRGDEPFELGGKKKVTVQEFKGQMLIHIREFYVDKNTGEDKVKLLFL